jgi:hypothetical protein
MNRSLLLLTLVLSPACVLDKDVGDSPADDSAEPGNPSSSGTDGGETDTDGTGTPNASACELNPDFMCDEPLGCETTQCGQIFSQFDAEGCPRLGCSEDRPCLTGYSCVRLGDWGTCGSSGILCDEIDGVCGCTITDDCSPNVAHCVEDEIAPPAACNTIDDETTCVASGCTSTVTQRVEYEEGGDCSCGELGPTCLWHPGGELGGDDAITPYVFMDDVEGYEIRLFPQSYDEPPVGWTPCSEVDWFEPCVCAASLACD